MTPTKRKRIYAESMPLPGELVKLPHLTPLWQRPGSKEQRALLYAGTYVMVVAVCDLINPGWWEWAYVLKVDGTRVGWIQTHYFKDENADTRSNQVSGKSVVTASAQSTSPCDLAHRQGDRC